MFKKGFGDMEKDLLKIIEHFGVNNQQRKLQEEVFELNEAITSFQLGGNLSYDEIEEEIVDVMILLKQFFHYYELNDYKMKQIEKQKVQRTLERIESGYYEK